MATVGTYALLVCDYCGCILDLVDLAQSEEDRVLEGEACTECNHAARHAEEMAEALYNPTPPAPTIGVPRMRGVVHALTELKENLT